MNKIHIMLYRGWDIFFKPDDEEFVAEDSVNDASDPATRKTLSGCKKFVDEFKKSNHIFIPFEVVYIGGGFAYQNERLKIIGIRKDGRFVAENEKGEKKQVSSYEEDRYALPCPEDEPIEKEIDNLEGQMKVLRGKIEALEKKRKRVTLEEHKKRYDYSGVVVSRKRRWGNS